jgi:heparan-alpha-glucosaminide N-acetyltransferase
MSAVGRLPEGVAIIASARLASLDAYRGFVMICLAANGFGLAETAKNFPDSAVWQQIGYQFEHVPWRGCAFWDLIQPSFMFMVGVALPFSMAKRQADELPLSFWGHVWWRAIILVLLGIFLSSNSQPQTNFTFVNVLTQIGLGYGLLTWIAMWPWTGQMLSAAAILIGYWAWFALSPLPPDGFDFTTVGISASGPFLTGFEAHWQKSYNAAATFDLWWMNLFPRPEPFLFNGGGYQTLNFIPSLVTMVFGVMAGNIIREVPSRGRVVSILLVAGLLGLASGWGLDYAGVCPLVKRIWTPSWTLFSTGWTLLMLAGFYGIIDGLGLQSWAFPLRVAGMNSIALYVMGQLLKPWTLRSLNCHFGDIWLTWLGTNYRPVVESTTVLLMFWLFVYWLYRQRVFLKI